MPDQRNRSMFYSLIATVLMGLGLPVAAQDAREVDLISALGAEMLAERQAAEAAALLAEQRKLIGEQAKLNKQLEAYLFEASRVAKALVDQRLDAVNQSQLDAVRAQARSVIDTVTDDTKQRVHDELDKHFAQLEEGIAITPDQLLSSSPKLNQAYKTISRGKSQDWVNRAAIMYGLCKTRQHQGVIVGNLNYRDKLTDEEAKAIDECNRRRLILGLSPLAIDFKLVEASRDHSKDMVTHDFFAHKSPVPGKESPWDRAKNFGTSASGENIATGYGTGHAATMGWWYSPGHLKNMMGGHRRIAVGRYQSLWTQMFGG